MQFVRIAWAPFGHHKLQCPMKYLLRQQVKNRINSRKDCINANIPTALTIITRNITSIFKNLVFFSTNSTYVKTIPTSIIPHKISSSNQRIFSPPLCLNLEISFIVINQRTPRFSIFQSRLLFHPYHNRFRFHPVSHF